MSNYSIYLDKETEKYRFIEIVRATGGKITDVSGCGRGYHICLLATPVQANEINRIWAGC